jgi:hypothetical protein
MYPSWWAVWASDVIDVETSLLPLVVDRLRLSTLPELPLKVPTGRAADFSPAVGAFELVVLRR